MKKEFIFYLPKLNKNHIIIARDEATAVWKLFNQFRLRESDVDGYRIMQQGKIHRKFSL